MERDDLLDDLFEHALSSYSMIIGAYLHGGLPSELALEKTEPKRKALAALYQRAGRAVPNYLLREDDKGETEGQ